MTRHFRFACLLVVAASVACAKGAGTNPLAPSITPATAAGARITGSAMPVGSATLAFVQVTVVGSTLSTQIDASNHFFLAGVPVGPVALRFSGSGVDATLPIGSVADGATVTLAVSLGANSAELVDVSRTGGTEFEVEGAVSQLPPAVDAGAFVVAGRTITTSGATRFFNGSLTRTFADLRLGTRVKVQGTTSGATSTATQVELFSTTETPPSTVRVTGPVTSKAGTAPALTLVVNGTTVRTSATTTVRRSGTTVDLSVLKVGQVIEVEGAGQSDGSVDAASISVEDEPAVEVSFTGSLTSKTGTAPLLTLVVDGTTVRTSSTTTVKKSGNTLDLSALTVGQTVEVEGLRQSDSTVDASKITVEDAPETETSITGALTAKSGANPVFTLVVGGTTVRTSATTAVKMKGDTLDLSVLAIGQTLEVEGLKQADNSINATKITIEESQLVEVDFEGTISGLSGVCPAIRFTAAGSIVQADSATDFRSACSGLTAGLNVRVRGVQLADLTIRAVRIEKK